MSVSNFSAKENTDEEVKSENESGIQDELQKYENFILLHSMFKNTNIIKLLWLISI